MKNTILLTIVFFLISTISYTQFGGLDSSFGKKGIVKSNLGKPYNYGVTRKDILVTPDGAFYSVFERTNQTFIAKRLKDGTKDSSYGEESFSDAINMVEEHAAMQSDGKLVLAGVTFSGTATKFSVARFNTNGSLDKGFSKDGQQITDFGSYGHATSLAIQPDGKIVVVGYILATDDEGESYYDFALVRYNSDGSLDKSFSDDGKQVTAVSYADDIPTSVAIQNDGKIVVVGYSDINSQFEKLSISAIVRYNADGSVDNTFSGDTQNFGFKFIYPNSAVIQKDGKIVIAGQTKMLTGEDEYSTTSDIFVARYNDDGSVDTGFGYHGIQSSDFGANNENVTSVKLQFDGKIVISGITFNGSNNDFALARYDINGDPDSTFGNNGLKTTDFGNSNEIFSVLSISKDEKIIVVGNSDNNNFAMARYNIDGSPDTTLSENGRFLQGFGAAYQGQTSFTATAVQSDEKMIAVGTTWNGSNSDMIVVRYNTNGSLDTTFGDNGVKMVDFGVFKDGATSVAIQSNGKIVVAGFTSDQSGSHFALFRLNKSGSFDSSFIINGSPEINRTELGRINALSLLNDGKILVAGTLWNGSNNDFGLMCFKSNGNLDSSFGVNGIVKTDFGSTEDGVKSMVQQPDGKILVVGMSTAYSSSKVTIIKYNRDGTIDPTYNKSFVVGDHDVVNAIAMQSDNKLVLGGSFYPKAESDNINSDFEIFRLDTTGTFDTTFNHTGFKVVDGLNDDIINSIIIQRNGRIIAGGASDNTSSLICLNSNGTLDSSFNKTGIKLTEASTSRNAIRGMAIYGNKLYTAGYGLFPGSLGLAMRYYLDDTLFAPSVSIVTPVSDTVYSAPATIKLMATASDADGTIAKVEFYNGNTLLYTETKAPYGFTWSKVRAGNYTITAKATDNSGLVSISAAVKISVIPHKAPTVSIVNPANNESFAGSTTIHLKAVALDAEGTISKVEFYSGATLLRTETTSPYTYTWTNVPVGKYTLTAKATNSFGLITTSASVHISVVPNKAPTVSITNIANGQIVSVPVNIALTASAKDPDGTISKVEFYNGTEIISTQFFSPYTCEWKDVPAGTYIITAKAIDNLGLAKKSASVTITVVDANAPIVSSKPSAISDKSNLNIVSLKTWPNPASDIININTTGLQRNKPTTISVISASGVIIKTMPANISNQITQLNISSFSKGVYTIKITSSEITLYKKFIKL